MKNLAWLPVLFAGACATSPHDPDLGVTDKTAPPGACGAIETHVVGIYEATGGHATVNIDRPGQHVLVLSAYEETTWNITLAPGAELVHVYATGYHAQHVAGVVGADVITESFDTDGTYACGYSYPYDGAGCDTDQLFTLANFRVHHAPTSFHGCHTASTWNIGDDLTTDSDCADVAASTSTTQEQADAVITCAKPAAGEDEPISCGGPLGD